MSDIAPLTIRLNANDKVVVAHPEILPNTGIPVEEMSTLVRFNPTPVNRRISR